MIFLLKKTGYSILVLIGVVILVFVMFQGFGDPARLIVGQTGDKKTLDNIRKELHLDQPKWKQFALYVNDVSPISIYSKKAMEEKKNEGNIYWRRNKACLKISLPG